MKKILMCLMFGLPMLISAAQLTLVGDRAWLSADGEALPEVLRLFEGRGVKVLVDPALNFKKVSGEWDGTKTERLIAQLAGPYSYVLEWRRLSGPLGTIFQLSGIRVFADGNASAARPLSSGKRVLDVIRGADGAEYIRGEILVGFGKDADLEDLNALLKKLGGTVLELIKPPGLYRIKINDDLTVEEALEIAGAHPGVKAGEPNFAFPRLENFPATDGRSGEGVNLHLQAGERAIAVLDSGLDPRYSAMSFIRGTYNALAPDEAMSDPVGHGTLMSLIASGAVTPLGAEAATSGAPVLAIRVFDENGYTSSDAVLGAINYAAQSDIEIINMSWGSEVSSRFMETAMNYAAEKGITLYASAGNEPTGEPIFPSGYASVNAVGGLNPDGTKWEMSNDGAFVQRYEPAKAAHEGQIHAGTSISSAFAAFREATQE